MWIYAYAINIVCSSLPFLLLLPRSQQVLTIFRHGFLKNILGPILVSWLYGKMNSDGRVGLSKTPEVMGMFDNVVFSRRM